MTSKPDERDASALLTTRPFGSTGLAVTPLCLGTSSWGPLRSGETPEARDERIGALADAFFDGDLPTNYLDTSNMYGGSESEALIGAAIARRGGLPEGVVLQTKLDRDIATGDFSAQQMWRSLEQSLERLGRSSFDVLFLHDPEVIGFETAAAPGGPMEALLEMKARGLARFVGISGGPVDMLKRFVETDAFDTLITHNRYTLVDRSANALLDSASQRGMGIDNAAPYGAGVLTGDPRFAGRYGYGPARPEVTAAIEAMSAICAEAGVSLGAAALQFSMRDPRIHSTVVGATSADRLDETVAHATAVIPDDLWAELDRHVPHARFALDAPR
ncbi:aldo/keto reductase [Compostimonas suwonensis]|uniref:D-threo-aldose 1-dehydrogenase n=1 Tax=Compostimonas suwonensis TaxID=1048394 RepID=A0A2M9C045_9MICO|nr:aldo/keto reductase [Compostimonas suwonensis]PJJ63680.1 D-threo-aldose 1-dehydrogenase [Compostimonas suwonensis]